MRRLRRLIAAWTSQSAATRGLSRSGKPPRLPTGGLRLMGLSAGENENQNSLKQYDKEKDRNKDKDKDKDKMLLLLLQNG